MKSILPAKLVKARLYLVENVMPSRYVSVQFNPSEYQISRSIRVSKKNGIGQDASIEKLQTVYGEFSQLSLSLYFDTETSQRYGGLTGVLIGALTNMFGKTPVESGKQISTLLKYNDKQHAPLNVCFVWGSLNFKGIICSSNVSYTMFSPSGTPIRAKVDLVIGGEEMDQLQIKEQRTFCSPNRTKERVLTQGDQLWMMAQQEYDNPAMWKPIAAANGILNPRRLDEVTTLKVPSIK